MNSFIKHQPKFKLAAILLAGFILFTSVATLFASNYYLHADQLEILNSLNLSAVVKSNTQLQTVKVTSIESTVQAKDNSGFVLDQYFQKYNSPLFGYGNVFVKACDQYQAPEDCITVAAIAKHETNLCTYQHSAEMFNCWGFGGGGEYRMKFSSFEESINKVTQVLAQQYGRKYMIDPELMERTFCGVDDPLCAGWGDRIKVIINDINEFSKSINMGDLISLRR